MNLITTFGVHNVTVEVVARSTKQKGIAVFLRQKVAGTKAVLGCRTMQADEAHAQAEYDRLVAETTAKGWALKAARSVGNGGRFTEIPAPPTAPVPVPETAKAEKKAANGKAKK